jgi:hypothetical protein
MTAAYCSKKALLKALTSPAKVARLLDKHGGPILSLNILRQRIRMALVYHPSCDSEPLESISTVAHQDQEGQGGRSGRRRRTIPRDCTEQLAQVVDEHEVSAFLVAWPLQRDTGKLGASCGRVLYTLESMISQQQLQQQSFSNENTLFTPSRPVCLWDSHSVDEQLFEDDWGRCASYGRPPPPLSTKNNSMMQQHLASEEQYVTDESITAADVWKDFCRAHWLELYQRKERRRKATEAGASSSCNNLISDWRAAPSYVQAAAAVLG